MVRRRLWSGPLALALALSGCAGRGDGGGGGGGEADAPVPLGDPVLAPSVRGVRLLVVGDSWARNLGAGLADAARAGRDVVVVNAGEPGCGLMGPTRVRRRGRMMAAPARCDTWPERWRGLVARYRPTAALLEVGYQDGQDSQELPGRHGVRSITDAGFRRRFDARMDQAIGILSAGGAKVYVPTVIDNDPAQQPDSDAMNDAVRAAVTRNPHAALLDLHGQLCTTEKICPKRLSGVTVYDDTGHPSSTAHDRLGRWILNSIHADPDGVR